MEDEQRRPPMIRLTAHALLRYAERVVGADIDAAREALAAAAQAVHASAEGVTNARESAAPARVMADGDVLQCLRTIRPGEIAAWEREIRATVEAHGAWSHFCVVCYRLGVRFVVRSFTLVTVKPIARWAPPF